MSSFKLATRSASNRLISVAAACAALHIPPADGQTPSASPTPPAPTSSAQMSEGTTPQNLERRIDELSREVEELKRLVRQLSGQNSNAGPSTSVATNPPAVRGP